MWTGIAYVQRIDLFTINNDPLSGTRYRDKILYQMVKQTGMLTADKQNHTHTRTHARTHTHTHYAGNVYTYLEI